MEVLWHRLLYYKPLIHVLDCGGRNMSVLLAGVAGAACVLRQHRQPGAAVLYPPASSASLVSRWFLRVVRKSKIRVFFIIFSFNKWRSVTNLEKLSTCWFVYIFISYNNIKQCFLARLLCSKTRNNILTCRILNNV